MCGMIFDYFYKKIKILYLTGSVFVLTACTGGEMVESVTMDSGLVMTTLQEGSGGIAETGQYVGVHYTGWLHDPNVESGRGQQFDSSVDRGTPFRFLLGAGRVIAGWDEGVSGMLIGEKRELIIPSELGYGTRGAGNVIPPNATLVFEVELLSIE
ncbi:MAG: peptidylprolyl isomerase [Rhodospirillaceae bacterium]|nr:peptidylprolyl isomerase [Rhodospirillaceae bacterium]|tara:strand:- start:13058 stop:13522 length:465 start_codon:yes stop_codon:yes gene_type:complete